MVESLPVLFRITRLQNLMKLFFSVFILGVALIPSACQTTNSTSIAPQRTFAVFESSFDTAWKLLIEEVGLNYPIAAVEKDSGLITTDFVSIYAGYNNGQMAQWVYPPGGFLSTWDGFRMKMNILVLDAGNGETQVTIRAHYEAFENNVRKQWVVCASNGAKENQILTSIENKISSIRRGI